MRSRPIQTGSINRLLAFVVAGLLVAEARGEAASVGTTLFTRGVVAAQLGDQPPRVLNKGAEIFEQDFIEAGPQSFAVITFIDDAKMTIRPNTALSVDKYLVTRGGEAAEITLQSGGIRASSGRIAERRPGGMLVHAAQATVEVHGANFDARLCGQDCAEEEQSRREETGVDVAETDAAAVVGRVALLRGSLRATAGDGSERAMRLGGSLYVEDLLETARGSHALLVFRDGERITLQQNSGFQVAARDYDPADPDAGKAAYKLLRGGMRALTGKISKDRPENYSVVTPVATTGIRGTLYDHHCEGDCVREEQPRSDDLNDLLTNEDASRPEGLYSLVHQGAIEQRTGAGSFPMEAPQSNYIANPRATPVLLRDAPLFMKNNPAPRPDQVPVDMQRLFGRLPLTGTPPGFYVFTRSGHVRLRDRGTDPGATDGRYVDLGKGETGYRSPGADGRPVRIEQGRLFLDLDSYPDPDTDNPAGLDSSYSILSGDPEKPKSFSCVCPI